MRLLLSLTGSETGAETRTVSDRQTSVLLFNLVCLMASRVLHIKRPGVVSLVFQIYFGINTIYLIASQGIKLIKEMLRDVLRDLKGNQATVKQAVHRPSSVSRIPVIKPEQKMKAHSDNTQQPHFQASIPGGAALRGIFPSTRKKTKHTTKSETFELISSKEGKQRHRITQQIEKDFRTWVHSNIITRAAELETATITAELEAAPLTHEERECVVLIGRNGYICYDKGNYTHNKALFKTIYNYFNSILPRSVSSKSNPMDEYMFTDLQKKGGVGVYGLLVEDARSSILSEEVFRVYFRYKNTLFDSEGDVILSFLFLIMHANIYTGEYLGALSLKAVGLTYNLSSSSSVVI